MLDFGDFLKAHGDAVRDVAFAVDDLEDVLKVMKLIELTRDFQLLFMRFQVARANNAQIITNGIEMLHDEAGDGHVRFASIHAVFDSVFHA